MSNPWHYRARRTAFVVGVVCVVAGATALAADAAGSVPSAHSADSAQSARPGSELRAASLSGSDQTAFVDGPGAKTVTGTGVAGFAGDGGPASSAELSWPGGIAIDGEGDVFIADTDNCRVREVPARTGTQFQMSMQAGRIYTVAGGSCDSSAGKQVGFVSSVAVDASGVVFLAGATTNRVLELPVGAQSGALRVIAGDGTAGYSGNGAPAASAEIDDPLGVATDPQGDVYIADSFNCVVREVASRSGTQWGTAMTAGDIYTIAGTGSCGESGDAGAATHAQLWDPSSVVYGPSGDLLIADAGAAYILCLPRATGTYYGVKVSADEIGVVAGTGMYAPYLIDGLAATGQTAEVNTPSQLAIDAAGDLFVADTYSSAIREVPARNGIERGVAVTAGNMYTVAGAFTTGNGNEQTKWVDPELLYPTGVAVAADGKVVYSDLGADVVREISGT